MNLKLKIIRPDGSVMILTLGEGTNLRLEPGDRVEIMEAEAGAVAEELSVVDDIGAGGLLAGLDQVETRLDAEDVPLGELEEGESVVSSLGADGEFGIFAEASEAEAEAGAESLDAEAASRAELASALQQSFQLQIEGGNLIILGESGERFATIEGFFHTSNMSVQSDLVALVNTASHDGTASYQRPDDDGGFGGDENGGQHESGPRFDDAFEPTVTRAMGYRPAPGRDAGEYYHTPEGPPSWWIPDADIPDPVIADNPRIGADIVFGVGEDGVFNFDVDGNGILDLEIDQSVFSSLLRRETSYRSGPGGDDGLEENDILEFRIVDLPEKGALYLDGDAVLPMTRVATNDFAKLTFVPDANEYGGDYASFHIQLYNGEEYSAKAFWVSVDVSAVNDAPTGADASLSMVEDGALTLGLATFGFEDVDGGDQLAAIQITALPEHGTLTLNGQAVGLNQVVSRAAILAGQLVFTPEANANNADHGGDASFNDGAGASTLSDFAFRLSDGTTWSEASYTARVDVTAVNDAPQVVDDVATLAEDGSVILMVQANDSEIDGDATTITHVNGSAIAVGGSVALPGGALVTLNADGSLRLMADGAYEGLEAGETASLEFSYTLSDGSLAETGRVTVTVQGSNDRPVLSAIEGAQIVYTEGDGAVAVTSAVQLTDADAGAVMASATIQIVGGYRGGEDLLSFTDGNGITGAWDAVGGTLTLTGDGSTTAADLQAAIRAVTYTNTNDADPKTGVRTLAITVHDGTVDSNTLYRNLAVSGANDAPVALADAGTLAEDGSVTLVVQANDSDADGDAFGITAINGVAVTAGNHVDLPGGARVTLNGDGTLNLAANGAYESLADGATDTFTFTYTLSDGAATSDGTVTITVQGANDAPVLANLEGAQIAYTEGGAGASLTDTLTLQDVDAGEIIATATLQIVGGYRGGEDTLAFTDGGGVTGAWDAVGGTLTLTGDGATTAADLQAAIRAVTYLNTNDADPASGTRTIAITVHDGDAASNTLYRTLAVSGANDAPVAGDFTVQGLEGHATALAAADFAAAYDDPDGDALDHVSITGGTLNKDAGSGADLNEEALLFLDENGNGVFDAGDVTLVEFDDAGTVTVSGAAASVAAADLGKVTFAIQDNGPIWYGDAVFAYTVNDGALDSAAGQFTVVVNDGNGTPVVGNFEKTVAEDGLLNLTALDFTGHFSDPDGDPLSQIRIADLSANGALWVDANGNGLIDGGEAALGIDDTVDAADLGDLAFAPTADFHGQTAFAWRGSDGGNWSGTASARITVTAVNDAPTTGDQTLTTIEDAPLVFAASNFTFADAADGDTLQGIRVTNLPTRGTLFLDADGDGQVDGGEAVVANTLIGIDQILSGQLTYRAPANANDEDHDGSGDGGDAGPFASFDFEVYDGSAYSAAAGTNTIQVTPANDGPDAVNDTGTLIENGQVTLTVLANDTDPDGDALAVSAINGALATVGVPVTLSNGAQVTLNADGTLTVQGNGAFDTLADGATSALEFGYTLSDGTATDTASVTLTVQGTNDAPVLSAIEGAALAYTEDDPATAISNTLGVADVDAGDAIASATVQITGNYVHGEDVLAFTDAHGITGAWDAGSGTLTLTGDGSSTPADFQAALRAVTYLNANTADPDTGDRTLAITVHDGTTDSNTVERTITVTAVNDAPTALDAEVTGTEDTWLRINAADFGYDDPEGDAMASVTITSLETAGTMLIWDAALGDAGEFRNVVIGDTITVAELADPAGGLHFAGNANDFGEDFATFRYKVTDDQGATSEASATMTIDLTAVNDAPWAQNTLVTHVEDDAGADTDGDGSDSDPYYFKLADFQYHDPEGDAMQAVRIGTAPVADRGRIYHWDGATWDQLEAGDEVSATDIQNGYLIYMAPWDANNEAVDDPYYDHFGFHVQDGEGAWSVNQYRMDVSIEGTPDGAATTGDMALTFYEDFSHEQEMHGGSYAFRLADFAGNESGSPLAETFQDLNGNGAYDAGVDTFTDTDGSGDYTDDLSAVGEIDGWAESGNQDVNLNANVYDMGETVIDNAGDPGFDPAHDGGLVAFDQGNYFSADFNDLAYVRVHNPGGWFKLNGAAYENGDWVARSQLEAGEFTFEPGADYNGELVFTYEAWDGYNLTNTSTLRINVLAVHDKAELAEADLSYTASTDWGHGHLEELWDRVENATDEDAGDSVQKIRISNVQYKVYGEDFDAASLEADEQDGVLANGSTISDLGTDLITFRFSQSAEVDGFDQFPDGAGFKFDWDNGTWLTNTDDDVDGTVVWGDLGTGTVEFDVGEGEFYESLFTPEWDELSEAQKIEHGGSDSFEGYKNYSAKVGMITYDIQVQDTGGIWSDAQEMQILVTNYA